MAGSGTLLFRNKGVEPPVRGGIYRATMYRRRLRSFRLAERGRAHAMNSACLKVGARALLCILGVVACVPASLAQGLGGLTVSPTRIVFEGRERSAEVTLVNTSSSRATYRISFKNMRMLENGSYEDIETAGPGELFADGMVRYSPRQVTLEPGMTQKVRMLLRKPAGLETGEYRSHLWFRTIPPETAGEDVEKLEVEEGELQIQIQTVFAITIPVTVRHGQLSASAAITDLTLIPSGLPDEPTVLSFRVNRSGNRTVSGEVEITFKSSDGDDKQVVGFARGIAVLNPYPTRTVRLPLRPAEGVVLQRRRQ